jgi:glycosyltransferase involved in cell wall biosynthesis
MSSKKKVWHLISNRWNSAITEYALSAARSLSEVEVENLFSPLEGSPAEKRAKQYGLQLRSFKDFSAKEVGTYKEVFKGLQPDAVIVYGGPESFLARFSSNKTKVFRFRGNEISTSFFSTLSQRLSLSYVKKIIVPGSPLLKDCRKIFGDERVASIILGCSTAEYKPNLAARKSDRPRMMIFGRFDPIKGHKEFLQIFRSMIDIWPNDAPQPQLVIAGESANISGADLRAEAAKNGLNEDQVVIKTERFLNVAEIMSSVSVGVVSSLGSEQICRVAEEFLLCGTAVALSGAGSLDDVLFEEAGFSYGGRTQSETAARLVQLLLKTYQEADQVRIVRSAKAKSIFSFATMGSALLKVCEL